MALTKTQEQVLQKWNDLGKLTPANPILQLAYEQYLSPMGLKCSGLCYDALAAVEDSDITPYVTDPVFDLSLIDQQWSQFPTIAPMLPLLDRIVPTFNEWAEIERFTYLNEQARTDPHVMEFRENYCEDIIDLSRTTAYLAHAYIDAALNALVADSPSTQHLCEVFLQNPRRYAELILEVLIKSAQQEQTN